MVIYLSLDKFTISTPLVNTINDKQLLQPLMLHIKIYVHSLHTVKVSTDTLLFHIPKEQNSLSLNIS